MSRGGAAVGGRGGDFGKKKEVELSSMVTAMVTRVLVNVVMMSDDLVGEAVRAW